MSLYKAWMDEQSWLVRLSSNFVSAKLWKSNKSDLSSRGHRFHFLYIVSEILRLSAGVLGQILSYHRHLGGLVHHHSYFNLIIKKVWVVWSCYNLRTSPCLPLLTEFLVIVMIDIYIDSSPFLAFQVFLARLVHISNGLLLHPEYPSVSQFLRFR